MNDMDRSEAVGFLTAAVDESHDDLVRFTEKLRALGDAPTFWLRDYPIHVRPATTPGAWPIVARRGAIMTLAGAQARFELPCAALADTVARDTGVVLTQAEAALMGDLATGLSLEDSAQAAGTAVTTRRKQLQHIFRKLGVGSQAELIALVSRVLHGLTNEIAALHGDGTASWGAYARHLPAGVRYGVIGGSDAGGVRYLDIGPVDGRPVMVLHPMLFPHLGPDDVSLIETLGWRTLWPIRPGCLSTTTHSSKSWDAHCAEAVRGMAVLHDMIGGAPLPIISLVSGGAYATAYAEAYPARVARIDFVSTCFSGGKHRSRDLYFGDAFLRSVQQNGRMALTAVQHLAGTLTRRPDTREQTARRVFGDCKVDQGLLDGEFATPDRVERFTFASLNSMDSMRYDYLAQVRFSWRRAAQVDAPKVFWHGAQDRVHRAGDLKRLAETVTGTAARILPEMGHLTQGAPLRDVFGRIADDILQTE
ncbi:MAG: helix-turn-helix transcriptional regulator [Pseudomonadota bacterium]